MSPKEFALPGLLITFEGGEGAGKTTLIDSLKAELIKRGHSAIKTREPGGSKLGDQIREWLLSNSKSVPICQRAELMLFLAARAQHIDELIKPTLKAGWIVLCDRFNDSSVAYQGIARGLGEEVVRQMCELVSEGLSPDFTFLIDVDPKVGLERTKKAAKENAQAGSFDRIEAETMEFHEKVQRAYRHIASEEPDRFCVLDGSKSPEEVLKDALPAIEKLLKR
jgi:dTMP kinase